MRHLGNRRAYAAGLAALLLFGLTACYPPPPGPPPGPPPAPPPPTAVAPPPPSYAPPPRIAYRRCAPGWHLVRGHRNRFGQWVRPHCRPNRRY